MWRFPNSPLSAMFHRVLRMVRSICPKEPERWISRYPADTQEDTAGRVVVVCRQQFWRFSGGRGIRLRLLDDILRLLFTCLACPTLTSLKFSTEFVGLGNIDWSFAPGLQTRIIEGIVSWDLHFMPLTINCYIIATLVGENSDHELAPSRSPFSENTPFCRAIRDPARVNNRSDSLHACCLASITDSACTGQAPSHLCFFREAAHLRNIPCDSVLNYAMQTIHNHSLHKSFTLDSQSMVKSHFRSKSVEV